MRKIIACVLAAIQFAFILTMITVRESAPYDRERIGREMQLRGTHVFVVPKSVTFSPRYENGGAYMNTVSLTFDIPEDYTSRKYLVPEYYSGAINRFSAADHVDEYELRVSSKNFAAAAGDFTDGEEVFRYEMLFKDLPAYLREECYSDLYELWPDSEGTVLIGDEYHTLFVDVVIYNDEIYFNGITIDYEDFPFV